MLEAAAGSSWKANRDNRGTWTLLFDRPGSSQNSLDTASLNELADHLAALEVDTDAARILLRSAKPRGFCAGADLRQIAACRTVEEVAAFARLGQTVFARLRNLPAPTIAVVHG